MTKKETYRLQNFLLKYSNYRCYVDIEFYSDKVSENTRVPFNFGRNYFFLYRNKANSISFANCKQLQLYCDPSFLQYYVRKISVSVHEPNRIYPAIDRF